MFEAHTIIAMIATVMLLWGLSLVIRALRFRLPRPPWRRASARSAPIGRRGDATGAAIAARPTNIPMTVAGALVAAGSIPVYRASAQVYLWSRSLDPTLAPFTPWTGVALGFVAFGAALAAWVLRGDRPRGRRRCARCWYDMTGAPGLVCPECGREAADESGLLRPRRRWRIALLGLLIVIVAIVPYYTPRIQRGGWPAAVPTTALIFGLRWWPKEAVFAAGGRGADDWSLEGRIEEERLLPWQRQRLRARIRALAASGAPAAAHRALRLGVIMSDPDALRAAADTLIQVGLDDARDQTTRIQALDAATEALYRWSWISGQASDVVDPHVPALTRLIAASGPLGDAAAPLLHHATDVDTAVPALIAMLRRPAEPGLALDRMRFMQSPQLAAAQALARSAAHNPAAAAALGEALSGPRLQQLAALFAVRSESAPLRGLEEAMTTRLLDPTTAVRAAQALSVRTGFSPAALAMLVGAIEDAQPPDSRLATAAGIAAEMAADPEPLTTLLDHPSWSVRRAIAIGIAHRRSHDVVVDEQRLLDTLTQLRATALPNESRHILGELDEAIDDIQTRIRRRQLESRPTEAPGPP